MPLPARPDLRIESEETVWAGRFPLDRVRFRHRRFDGAWSGTRTWELWRRGRAGAVLPYDPVQDRVVLLEQYRLPAAAAEHEDIRVRIWPAEEAIGAALAGAMPNVVTAVALLWLAARRATLRELWAAA